MLVQTEETLVLSLETHHKAQQDVNRKELYRDVLCYKKYEIICFCHLRILLLCLQRHVDAVTLTAA
jgi:hypothetical protein